MSTLTTAIGQTPDVYLTEFVEVVTVAHEHLSVPKLVADFHSHLSFVANGDYDSNPGHPMPELHLAPHLADEQITTGEPNGDYQSQKPEPTGGWIVPGM